MSELLSAKPWQEFFAEFERILSLECNRCGNRLKVIVNNNLEGKDELCLICSSCKAAYPLRAEMFKDMIEYAIDQESKRVKS